MVADFRASKAARPRITQIGVFFCSSFFCHFRRLTRARAHRLRVVEWFCARAVDGSLVCDRFLTATAAAAAIAAATAIAAARRPQQRERPQFRFEQDRQILLFELPTVRALVR